MTPKKSQQQAPELPPITETEAIRKQLSNVLHELEGRDRAAEKMIADIESGPQAAQYVGWKDICAVLGGISRTTAWRWTKYYELPIIYAGKTPLLSVKDLYRWNQRLGKKISKH